jgi:tRNA threonylcarbamoyladenosine biosynthesis protein TsaB
MIVLGIESATELVGACVGTEEGPIASVWIEGRRRHAEALAPAVAEVLSHAGLAVADVELLAADVGPGLFTGLRVGVALTRGLAQGLGVGCIGLTSLEILAHGDTGPSMPVLAVVDARRGEVFAQGFGANALSGCRLGAPGRYDPAALARELAALELGPCRAVGNGALRYAELLGSVPELVIAPAPRCRPAPDALVDLALIRLAHGATPVAGAELGAVYLRDADVRRNWAQRAHRDGPAG